MTTAIRLAQPQDNGAVFLNAYNYLMLLASLYGDAAQYDQRSSTAPFWADLSDALLVDLGELYALWESGLAGADLSALESDEDLYRRVVVQCLRSERIQRRMDMWTPTVKRASILRLLEKKWCRLSLAIGERVPGVASQMKRLTEQGHQRVAKLEGLLQVLRDEADRYGEIGILIAKQQKV